MPQSTPTAFLSAFWEATLREEQLGLPTESQTNDRFATRSLEAKEQTYIRKQLECLATANASKVERHKKDSSRAEGGIWEGYARKQNAQVSDQKLGSPDSFHWSKKEVRIWEEKHTRHPWTLRSWYEWLFHSIVGESFAPRKLDQSDKEEFNWGKNFYEVT